MAGLFDQIFGFGGGVDAAREAADRNAQLYGQYGTDITRLAGNYGTGSLAALGTGQQQALESLRSGLGQQVGAYQQGLTGALGAGQAGVAAYDPLRTAVGQYSPAIQAYLGSIGVGGPEARAAAERAFTESPGYQYQVEQAQKRAAASASRLGIAGSGNTLQALDEDRRKRAAAEYGGWQDRLQQFVPLEQQGLTAFGQGVSGANRTLADIYSSGYGRLGEAYGLGGKEQGALQYGYGQDVGNIYGNLFGAQAGAARDVTTGLTQAQRDVAQAEQQAAANKLGFWGSVAGAAVRGATAGMGGGGSNFLGMPARGFGDTTQYR